jgi:hypothetical protein
VNTYALFAEHFLNLTNASGGAGVIVPTGIATDATTAPFFGHLVTSSRLAGLVDFENSQPMFPGVHRSFKFTLLTLGNSVKEAEFAFFLTDPVQLEDPRRRFTLSPKQIAAINPNTKTAPVFRARANADLISSIYDRVPIFMDETRGEAGNPWRASFMRMFDMSNDSHLFRTAEELKEDGLVRDGTNWVGENGRRYVPLFESKLFGFFNHRRTSYGDRDERGHRVLPEATLTQLQDPNYEPTVYYWVPENELMSQIPETLNSFCMFSNKVMGVSNERTMIVLPHYLAAGGDSVLYVFSKSKAEFYTAMIANFASIVNDFVVRNKTSGVNITFFLIQQLPIIPPSAYSEADLAFIVPRVLELSYTSHSMAPFARDLGYEGPPFAWDEDRRAQLRAELDAWYALAYGLTRDELRYVLDPKDVMGEDYPSETFRVLQKNEIAKYGEYRTQRLVLAAYDALVAGGMRPRTEGYK